jgi:hypothetical protein
MPIATTTALIIAFTGANGNMTGVVRESVKAVTHQTPIVMTVSGSGADKMRVSEIGKPLTQPQILEISAEISRRSSCEAAPPRPTRQTNTVAIDLTCKPK